MWYVGWAGWAGRRAGCARGRILRARWKSAPAQQPPLTTQRGKPLFPDPFGLQFEWIKKGSMVQQLAWGAQTRPRTWDRFTSRLATGCRALHFCITRPLAAAAEPASCCRRPRRRTRAQRRCVSWPSAAGSCSWSLAAACGSLYR